MNTSRLFPSLLYETRGLLLARVKFSRLPSLLQIYRYIFYHDYRPYVGISVFVHTFQFWARRNFMKFIQFHIFSIFFIFSFFPLFIAFMYKMKAKFVISFVIVPMQCCFLWLRTLPHSEENTKQSLLVQAGTSFIWTNRGIFSRNNRLFNLLAISF